MPKESKYLMVAKTLTSLRRNCLDLLQELAGSKNFTYTLSQKEGFLFGRKVYLEGVNDARAEGKIRGMTLQGAYCDELTLFTDDFFSMLLSRLSEPGAKLIGTTNPDNPNHWLMQKYINRQNELDMLVVKFLLEDNVFLGKEYIENLKKEYTGIFYDRYILGLWRAAEGVIYDMFDRAKHVVPTQDRAYTKYYVSCDYGTQNPTVFGLWGHYNGKWYKVKEYYHSGREAQKQKTDSQYADDYQKFVEGLKVEAVIVDPSAASFIAELRSRGIRVRKADNDVLDGIRTTASLLEKGYIVFNDCCVNTLREMESYVWNAKAADKGEDAPLKVADHTMDATRYFCYTMLRHLVKPERKNYSGKGARR